MRGLPLLRAAHHTADSRALSHLIVRRSLVGSGSAEMRREAVADGLGEGGTLASSVCGGYTYRLVRGEKRSTTHPTLDAIQPGARLTW